MTELNALSLLGYLLLVVGLVGSVVPILPGPLLIWLGAFVWAWGDGFERIGWPTLLGLGVLAIIAWAIDLILTTAFTRKAGASWKAIGGAIAGGLLGGLFLGLPVPVCGSLLGAVVGAIAGMIAVEYYTKRSRPAALAAVRAYIAGVLVSAVAEIALALVMIAIFVWQAF